MTMNDVETETEIAPVIDVEAAPVTSEEAIPQETVSPKVNDAEAEPHTATIVVEEATPQKTSSAEVNGAVAEPQTASVVVKEAISQKTDNALVDAVETNIAVKPKKKPLVVKAREGRHRACKRKRNSIHPRISFKKDDLSSPTEGESSTSNEDVTVEKEETANIMPAIAVEKDNSAVEDDGLSPADMANEDGKENDEPIAIKTGTLVKKKGRKIPIVVELDPTLLVPPPTASALKSMIPKGRKAKKQKKDRKKVNWVDDDGTVPLTKVHNFEFEGKGRLRASTYKKCNFSAIL